jgi:6-phosphogluconolactonase (cycloisomerase 2 family)
MGFTNRIFLVLAIVAGMTLVGCGKQQCPNSSLSGSGTGSGSSGGITTSNVCGSGSSTGGGGGGGGGSTTSVFLYYFALDNTGAGTIEAAGLSNTGTLALLNPFTPPTLPSTGTDNMVIVNKQFLYVPMGDSTVQAFAINRTSGALTPITGSPFSAAGGDTAVSDPKGRFLFVGGEGVGAITVFKIDQTTGALTTTGTFQSFNMVSADSLAVDGKGNFLYAGQGDIVTPLPIVAFSIDQSSGALTEIAGSPFNLGVATVHADSSGKFLLGVAGILDQPNSATDDHISVFSIDSAGTPTAVAGSPFSTTAAPFEFAIHPSGQFVYTFGTDSTKAITAVEGYQLSSTGTLTKLPNSPFISLPIVQDCQFDQSGGVAFCIDSVAGTKFSVLTANPTTGALTHTVQDLTVTSTFPFAITD